METTFKTRAWRKFVENILSVKVWIIFALLGTSSIFLAVGLMPAAIWASVNGGVISTVCAMREAVKIAKIKTPDEIIGKEKDLMV